MGDSHPASTSTGNRDWRLVLLVGTKATNRGRLSADSASPFLSALLSSSRRVAGMAAASLLRAAAVAGATGVGTLSAYLATDEGAARSVGFWYHAVRPPDLRAAACRST